MHWTKQLGQRTLSIFILLIMFVIGFTSGFFISQLFQIHTGLSPLPIITWFGSGVGILGLFREWFKDRKIPRLRYDGEYRHGNTYFLKIKMVTGVGMAEGCIANLDINGTEIENTASVWGHNLARPYDIGPPMGLMLFQINNETNSISFPSAHAFEKSGCVLNTRPYYDFMNREIIVNVYSKTGRRPSKPYIKKISDIVDMNPIR
jgi:uncharacterized protein YneF (UPF0154 family)